MLHLSPGHYCSSRSAPCRLDTELFEGHIEEAQQKYLERERWAEALERCEKAVELYRGDLLAEDRYAEWTLAPREHFHRLFLDALANSAECHAQLGQYLNATEKARCLIRQDPTRESAYRQLMLYEYYRGELQRALQAYEACAQALRERIDMELSRQTRALRNSIREGKLPSM